MKVYLVKGETGQYDDYTHWIAAIFLSQEKAEEFAKKAKEHIDALVKKYERKPKSDSHWDILEAKLDATWDAESDPTFFDIDPSASLDYHGVKYSVIEREIIE